MDSFMEFVKKTDPEGYAKMQKIADQINEAIEAANKRADAMEELEALKKKGRKLNAGGGLNYLMGL
jgi:dsDNA-binding SOS-regulon protein